MSRKEPEKDLERPHFYSRYWMDISRQFGGGGDMPVGVMEMDQDEDEEDELSFAPPPRAPIAPVVDDFELPPTPRPVARPTKARAPEPRHPSLSSFADLAALGFGEDAEMEEMPVSDDDDAESIISRLGSSFGQSEDLDDIDVVPDEEEAASLESLSEEEDWDEEEDEDDIGAIRHNPRMPPKPARPRRERGF